MKKIILILFIVGLLFSACSVSKLDRSVKSLELGMSKKQVIRAMGDKYTLEFKSVTPEGNVEALRYHASDAESNKHSYVLHFLDGNLVEVSHHFMSSKQPAFPHPRMLHE